MFLAIPPTLPDCSSVKSLCPQEINFHHFPLEWTWQQKKCLSFGKLLLILKERYSSKGSPDPRQTKNEKTVLSLFWGQRMPRGMIRVLAPCGIVLTVFASNTAVLARGVSACCKEADLSTDLLPCAFLMGCFVLFCLLLPTSIFSSVFGTVEVLACWHGSYFSLSLSLSELLLHCSHPILFCFLWHQHFPAIAVAVHCNPTDVLHKPRVSNHRSNVFPSVVPAFILNKY